MVETPGGQWLRVGVGPFTPIEFSAADRTRLLLSTPSIWLSILAVVAGFLSLAFVMPVCRWPSIVFSIAIASLTYAAYVLTNDTAYIVLAGAVALTLFIYLKRRQIQHKAAGRWH